MTSQNLNRSAIAVTFILSILVGWAACHIWESRKEPITIENPINQALIKRGDSLEAVIVQMDIRDSIDARKDFVHDSIVIKNHKTLSKDYDKITKWNTDSMQSYIDNILVRPKK